MDIKKKLHGKTALITGASSGIGKATAIHLAKRGCNIFMVARRQQNLKEVEDQIEALGGQAKYTVGDVADEELARSVVDETNEIFNGLDIMVLCAGISLIRSFQSTTISEFQALQRVNTFGVVNFCKAGVRKMNNGGSIVLITSPAGVDGAKGMSAYALSKGGLIAFGKCLALELAPQKIRVNMISPGFVKTEMTEGLYGKLSEKQQKQIRDSYPLGIGCVADVVNAIDFLVNEESAWITGTVLKVDGGFTAGR
jgi:NAD(P)-dependent dehydrogenase (short-subunit alcohol dehydrogenase family)